MSVEANGAKKALRMLIKQNIAKLDEKHIQSQSQIAQEVVISLAQYRRAKRIGVYLSMSTSEARTDLCLRHALNSGKEVFVPYIHAMTPSTTTGKTRKGMAMLRLNSIEEYEQLKRDSWGIPSLATDSVSERENALGGTGIEREPGEGSNGGLDVIIVPGVAFSPDGCRMGHGRGFYDRFLTHMCGDRKLPKPYLLGLCLTEQILPIGQMVMQPWDWKVDAVAVGDGRLLTV
ncbi:5-formyltetrahydrofolate cyclo-ligase [Piedraia hortae CBS 480.64]|uniref:5-formyltetrahydrofolate cyclo-ligase n=1 Tax=Piedraia hortae CBS 480.64 TaxID=1314780 RepID=A0A6A7CAT1_9PEZI|nr:5-formyltetrahydrofolate cyclo-ligase [Piedraia hortae CBS 480.64]